MIPNLNYTGNFEKNENLDGLNEIDHLVFEWKDVLLTMEVAS